MTTLELIREQNRIRAKRYYEKHREKISERRKESRGEPTIKERVVEVPVYPRRDEINKLHHDINLLSQEIKEIKRKKCINEPEKADKKLYPYTKDGLHALFKERVKVKDSNKEPRKETKSYYVHNVNYLFGIFKRDNKGKDIDFLKYLQDYKKTIEIIRNAKKLTNEDEDYSNNSKRGLFQTISRIIEYNDAPVSEEGIEEYDKYFRVYRDEADKEAKEKAYSKAVLDINVWFNKINEKYPIGDDLDKKSLITHLKARLIALFYYKIATFRDDLKELLIIPSESDNVSPSTNYIVVPQDEMKHAKFILNEDKTSNKNKSVTYDIDTNITEKIREFMKLKKITYNHYLFGKVSLSNFINKIVVIEMGAFWYSTSFHLVSLGFTRFHTKKPPSPFSFALV